MIDVYDSFFVAQFSWLSLRVSSHLVPFCIHQMNQMKSHNVCIVLTAPVNIFLMTLSEFVLCHKCTTILIAISCLTVNMTKNMSERERERERKRDMAG